MPDHRQNKPATPAANKHICQPADGDEHIRFKARLKPNAHSAENRQTQNSGAPAREIRLPPQAAMSENNIQTANVPSTHAAMRAKTAQNKTETHLFVKKP